MIDIKFNYAAYQSPRTKDNSRKVEGGLDRLPDKRLIQGNVIPQLSGVYLSSLG